MQLGRLFEIVYLLLDRKTMTAAELAQRFEVSPRTIYRDVDTLAQAGVPVYAERGKGGGIRMMEGFVLNKAALSETERRGVLSALQGMNALGEGESQAALDKLSALFGGESEDWVELDFASWNAESPVSQRFQTLKEAIFARRVASFRYSGADGSTRQREAEPVKLVFRSNDWYLLAWCRWREDFRYFKLSRMDGLTLTQERFRRRQPPRERAAAPAAYAPPSVKLELEFRPDMAYRVREEFTPEQREELPDGGFLVRMAQPETDWMYQWLMTYGGAMRVRAPDRVRRELYRRHLAALERNQEE